MRSALYVGTVTHARRAPAENVFRYGVYMTLIDIDELPELDRRLPGFGWNRRALTTYRDSDHVDVRAFLASNGVDLGPGGRLQVLTNLRVLGYGFNPVSFWWCHAGGGTLRCIVAETSNTFGERLPYLLSPANALSDGRGQAYETDKRLHVSPFMSMDQRYRWFFSELAERVDIRIDVHEEGMPPFRATLRARRLELTARTLRSALVRYPLMPAKVIARIHLQAGHLWLKRVPIHRKPRFVPGRGTVRS